MKFFNYPIKAISFSIICLHFILSAAPAVADNQSRMQQAIAQYKSAPNDLKSASTRSMIDELLLNPTAQRSLDASTKKMIEEQFDKNLDQQIIILASLAGIESTQEKIRLLAATKPLSADRRFGNDWAAKLMMARLGDQVSLSEILAIANSQNLHMRSTRVTIDFKYVPQLATLDFLKNQLFSDERLERIIETVPGSLVAKYAMASLAVLLKNFPLEYRDHFGYTDDEVILAREWISKQTEWKFR